MFTRSTTQPAATVIDGVRCVINGKAMIASPATDTTAIIAHDESKHRCSITSRDAEQPIALVIEDDFEGQAWLAAERVREAAARPVQPRSGRPSARVAAGRKAARENHTAVWQAGYSEGQARFAALPLAEKVTDANLDELIELAMRAVLGNPELRNEFRNACDAAEIEQAIAPSVPEWIAERQAG